jgi:hypothetical protein
MGELTLNSNPFCNTKMKKENNHNKGVQHKQKGKD